MTDQSGADPDIVPVRARSVDHPDRDETVYPDPIKRPKAAKTVSLPDAGYWLFARGVALPPGHPSWGRCENCNDREQQCWSCQMRVAAENLIRDMRKAT